MSSGKIIDLLLVIGLIAGGGFLYIDFSGDGLRTYRQASLIGNVEGDPLEYDTSGDGIPDGQVHEMGLNPSESYPAVVEAFEGGLDENEASLFRGINPEYVEEGVEYLAGNPEKLEAVFLDERASELGIRYAEDFSPKALTNLSRLGDATENNVDFAEALLGLPEDVHTELAEDYTEDGVASLKERNQARFLNLLQEDDKLQDFLQEYDPANANVSGDGFTNYFSLTRSDVIDWDEKNRRFVIDTLPSTADDYPFSPSDDFVREVGEFYEEKMGIPENQVHRFIGQDATWENFQKITDELEDEVTKNDILVWSASGEGAGGSYGFYDEHPTYTVGSVPYIYILTTSWTRSQANRPLCSTPVLRARPGT